MDMRIDELEGGEDHAAETAALSVDMLCRGIDDAVGAKFERLLQERRRKDIVDDEPGAASMHDFRDYRNVEDIEAGIGRGFQKGGLGFGPHRGAPLRDIGAVNEC